MPDIYRLPCLLADPPPAAGATVLRNGRVFDGTGTPAYDGDVLVVDGKVAGGDPPPGGVEIDVAGKFVMPGLIDAHSHLSMGAVPTAGGAERLRPGVMGHFIAAELRRALRMGITTIREVGAYGDVVLEIRQAIRYGAFRGPRLLSCGRIVSATSPGGAYFTDMYREADGPDEMRKAAREQIRRGADFVKIMSTGARSVELENPEPSQVTAEEMAAIADETHRLGYRLAAHCEGLGGTELAVRHGADTIEHGFHLHRRPDLLEELAARGGVLVPTLTFLHDIADTRADQWSPHLVERGAHNLAEAYKTVEAALAAGVPMAMGFDSNPEHLAAAELGRMVDAGLTAHQALTAATGTGAKALAIDDVVGTIEPGKLADLVVVDGDPGDDVGILTDPDRIHLVLQSGAPVAGAALELTAR